MRFDKHGATCGGVTMEYKQTVQTSSFDYPWSIPPTSHRPFTWFTDRRWHTGREVTAESETHDSGAATEALDAESQLWRSEGGGEKTPRRHFLDGTQSPAALVSRNPVQQLCRGLWNQETHSIILCATLNIYLNILWNLNFFFSFTLL